MAGNLTRIFVRLVAGHDIQEGKNLLHLKRGGLLSPFRTGAMLLASVDATPTILRVLAGIKAELSVELDVEKNSCI